MGKWKRVKVGNFLEQRKKQLLIEADIEYLFVTISNKGEVNLREKKKGGLINAQKGYCVKTGDFIYSRLAVHTGVKWYSISGHSEKHMGAALLQRPKKQF